MNSDIYGSGVKMDKGRNQQESSASHDDLQRGIVQKAEGQRKQTEEFIKTCLITIRQLLSDGVIRKDNLYFMYKEIISQLYGEKSQLSPSLLISEVLEVININIHRDPKDVIFVEKYDGVDLTIKLVKMDDPCYSVHALELLNSLLKSPERTRQYALRYDLDSLFHQLVTLIGRHIDSEFYVSQGLYSLSSCIAFGNVKFSITDLIDLLHMCMKYTSENVVFHINHIYHSLLLFKPIDTVFDKPLLQYVIQTCSSASQSVVSYTLTRIAEVIFYDDSEIVLAFLMENHFEDILINQIKRGEIDCVMVSWQILCAILERENVYNDLFLNSELLDLALEACSSKDDPLLQQIVLTDLALLLTSANASQMQSLAEKKVIEAVFDDPTVYSSPPILTSALQNIVNLCQDGELTSDQAVQYLQQVPLHVLGQLIELDPSAKSLINSYFAFCPEYASLTGLKHPAASRQCEEAATLSLRQLTLQEVKKIREMEEMPLPLLEEYYVFMFNECSFMMQQRIESKFLPYVDACLGEFQEYDVLQFKHMMYDVMMSKKDSAVVQTLTVLHPNTVHLLDQVMSSWETDFYQNVKNVVINLERHEEKSFIIYYTDRWNDINSSDETLSFEYDQCVHTQFCFTNDRMNFLFTLITAYCLLCLDYFPLNLFVKYLVRHFEDGETDMEDCKEDADKKEISSAIWHIWQCLNCEDSGSFIFPSEEINHELNSSNPSSQQQKGSRFDADFISSFETLIESYLKSMSIIEVSNQLQVLEKE